MSTVNPRYSLPLSKYKRKPASLPLSEEYPLNALSFDGVNDYVEVSDSPSLDITGEHTIISYIKRKTTNVRHNIVAKLLAYLFFIDFNNRITIWLFDGSVFQSIQFSTEITGDLLNKVIQIGYTYDGKYANLIINGNIVESIYKPVSINVSIRPLRVGLIDFSWARPGLFNGMVESVLVYKRAFSNNEIKQLSRNPYYPPLSGCVLWLSPESIDENAGIWYDKSGHGNNGTIYGAKKVKLQQYEVSL